MERVSAVVQGDLLKCMEPVSKLLVLAPLLSVVSDGFFDEPSEGLAFAVECLTSLQPLVSMDPDKMDAVVVSLYLQRWRKLLARLVNSWRCSMQWGLLPLWGCLLGMMR